MSKAKIPVVLFEDPGCHWFGPPADTRPLWELGVGPGSPLSLAVRALGEMPLLCSRSLFSDRPALPASGEVILLNARQLLLAETAAEDLQSLASGEQVESGSLLLAQRMPASEAQAYLEDIAVSQPGEPLPTASLQGPWGPVLGYWWDVLDAASSVHAARWRALRAGGINWRQGRDWVRSEDIHFGEGCKLGPGAILDASSGPIILGDGVEIGAAAYIQGPAWLGDGTRVRPQARLLHGVWAGPHCRLGGEIEESQFQGFANKQHDGFLGHAVIGEWVNLGAGTNNSDLKNNYSEVRIQMRGRSFDTRRRFLGCCLGDHVKIAIGGRLGTGTVLEAFTNWLGADFPPRGLPAFIWGKDGSVSEYEYDKAMATARIVMSRRGQELSPALEKIYKSLFARDRSLRKQA